MAHRPAPGDPYPSRPRRAARLAPVAAGLLLAAVFLVRCSGSAAPNACGTGAGYWVLGKDGSVRAFGQADPHGSLEDMKLAAPAVALIPTPSHKGYWIVGADGGVFAFGDAPFYGGAAGRDPGPFVGLAPTLSAGGYWLITADGRTFPFGDARQHPALTPATGSRSGGGQVIGVAGSIPSFGGC